mmetsp:Transcript_40907/g.127416  ORF Transcript_40907/g.127416 Transcript_40907/m.127416 type:complete len:343 (-) Transcript_40907:220-1248(-)
MWTCAAPPKKEKARRIWASVQLSAKPRTTMVSGGRPGGGPVGTAGSAACGASQLSHSAGASRCTSASGSGPFCTAPYLGVPTGTAAGPPFPFGGAGVRGTASMMRTQKRSASAGGALPLCWIWWEVRLSTLSSFFAANSAAARVSYVAVTEGGWPGRGLSMTGSRSSGPNFMRRDLMRDNRLSACSGLSQVAGNCFIRIVREGPSPPPLPATAFAGGGTGLGLTCFGAALEAASGVLPPVCIFAGTTFGAGFGGGGSPCHSSSAACQSCQSCQSSLVSMSPESYGGASVALAWAFGRDIRIRFSPAASSGSFLLGPPCFAVVVKPRSSSADSCCASQASAPS